MKSTWRMLVLTIISIGPLTITASCSSNDGNSATIGAKDIDVPAVVALIQLDDLNKTDQTFGERLTEPTCGVFL